MHDLSAKTRYIRLHNVEGEPITVNINKPLKSKNKMSSRTRTVLGYVISLLFSGVLLCLVFKNVSWNKFIAQAEQADYRWVVLSIFIFLISYVVRAYRWNILINSLGYSATTFRSTQAVMIGYLVNLMLPRVGEVTRCGILKKSDNVPISISLGTVITERIIDLITLVFITILTFVFEFHKLSAFLGNIIGFINTSQLISIALITVALLGFGGAVIYWLYHRFESQFRVVLGQLIQGLLSLRKISNIKGFIFSTLILWIAYYFMGYLIFFAVAETSELGWSVGLMLLVMGGVAFSIPVQGGFGTYHSIVSSMLLLYQIDTTTGVFFATLAHSTEVAATVLYGVVGLFLSVFYGKSPQQKPV
jgi:uncharacterized protein (TIRG00374 family)